MRGVFFPLFSFFGVVLFSVGLFSRSSFFELWIFLELVSLCLIPSFFVRRGLLLMESLFNYLIFSSVSSSLLVVGVLCEDCFLFVILGLFIKFGVFPFSGWVYSVVCKSKWAVV